MTLRLRRTCLHSTVAVAGLAFAAFSLTARAATPQKDEKGSKEVQAKKESQEAAELEKIEAKLRGLEQEINELRAAGKVDAAEKLAREGRDLKAALQKQDAGKGKKDGEGVREGEAQLKRLAAEIEELKAAGKFDAAEKLEREARQLKEKLAAREGDAAKKPDEKRSVDKKPEGKKPAGESAELAAKIDAMQHEAAKLREAGRTDEAEKILRQVAELRARSKLADGKGKPDSGKPRDGDGDAAKKPSGEGAELVQKLIALEAERAKLLGAGQAEEAQKVRRQVDELRTELDRVQANHDRKMAADFERRRAEIDPVGHASDIALAIKELRGEVSRLRNEVAELRKIVGKEKGDEPRREKGDKKDNDDKKDPKKGEKKGDDDKKDVKKPEKKDGDDKKDSKTDK